MQHPDEGTIHAWLDGALDDRERHSVEQHIASCAECAAAVADARGMIAGASRIVSMLDGVRGGVIPAVPAPTVRPRSNAMRRAVVGGALAASLIVAVTVLNTSRDSRRSPMVDAVATAAPGISAATGEQPKVLATPAPAPAPLVGPATTKSIVTADAPATRRAVSEQTAARVAGGPPHVAAADSMAVVATTAIAPPAASPADARRTNDSTRKTTDSMRAMALGVGAPAFSNEARRAGAAPRARQLAEVAATDAPTAFGGGFLGCYTVAGDSTAWPRSLPARFSLAQSDSLAGAIRNVVHVARADGRLDTAATAGTWRQLTVTTVHVSFAASPAQAVTLRFASNGSVLAQRATAEATEPVTLARASCRP